MRKIRPSSQLLLRRVFRGPSARRGPGSESDSPPRWSVSPPSLSPLMSPLMSPLHPAPVFGAKSAQNGRVRRVRFCVGLQVGCPSLQVRRFSVESRLQTSVFRFRAGKAANSSPPSMSPLVALSPLSVSPPSLSPLMSPLMSPLLPAPFLVQKALKTFESEESVFRVGLQVGCLSLQIRRFSVESGLQTSVFRFRAGKAANSSPPSMSPLVTACHRFVTALFGAEKCAKGLEKRGRLRGFDGFANPG